MPKLETRFLELMNYWIKKLKLKNVALKKDNRIKWSACVEYLQFPFRQTIRYNIKNIEERHWGLIHLILHELGHIVEKTSGKDPILSEGLAERFALDTMKKYYRRDYFQHIQDWKEIMSRKEWQKDNPRHYYAFIQLEEYEGV